MEEFIDIGKILAFCIVAMIGAYIACRGAYYNKKVHALLGSDLLAVCSASIANLAFFCSIEVCFAIFLVVLASFSMFTWKQFSTIKWL